MTGPSVHLFTQGKMLEEGILGSFIIAVSLALIFEKGPVDVEICVNMLMGFLSAGYTLLNIEPGCARMAQTVRGEFAFLPTLLRSSAHYMYPLVLLFPLLAQGTSAAAAMDFAAAMNLLPGSPSAASIMSPSPFTPPMSPSGNGMPHSSLAWPQPNVPALHLPGCNMQSSRLRSSLNARDIPADYSLLPEFDVQQQHLLSELSSLSQPSLSNNSLNRSGRLKALTPSNLDDFFSAESSSPRYADQALASAVFSPTHKSAVLNQFQPQQSMLSPINTNFSPKNVDHPLLQASFASGRMSPRSMEPISPMSSRSSVLAQREKLQQLRSLSSRELGSNAAAIVGSPVNIWSKWGSSNGKPDWTVSTDELGKLRRSNSFELGNGDDPDLSWVQSLVKESPTEMKEKLRMPISGSVAATASSSESSNMNSRNRTY
ncbi:ARM REPEAT CCCH-TYPE ZINC FINGER PROTEIN [Salix purpurea]|uniref:ARM REPEAT CCCH-TYPE ZINC FINGER PROTEIN n=1 Tax=Salix purpurea TaxID=77065 RepID=A0A9Q1A365_SALPP|nr:ARM REPEAT CCCH-TYPE ZINC FINGER PROTEIN [Salix purpurea]